VRHVCFISLYHRLTPNSIAYGVIAGVISFILINGIAWALRKVSGDRITPPNYDEAERWVVPPGGIVPVWMYVTVIVYYSWHWYLFVVCRLKLAGKYTPPEDQPMEESKEETPSDEKL
jgi:hypothetical protein